MVLASLFQSRSPDISQGLDFLLSCHHHLTPVSPTPLHPLCQPRRLTRRREQLGLLLSFHPFTPRQKPSSQGELVRFTIPAAQEHPQSSHEGRGQPLPQGPSGWACAGRLHSGGEPGPQPPPSPSHLPETTRPRKPRAPPEEQPPLPAAAIPARPNAARLGPSGRRPNPPPVPVPVPSAQSPPRRPLTAGPSTRGSGPTHKGRPSGEGKGGRGHPPGPRSPQRCS